MEQDQKQLIRYHNISIALNAVSVVALYLLSIDFLWGIIPLIVITIMNNFFAEKRKELGGRLPDNEKKKMYKRKGFAYLFILVIVLPLLLFPFPPGTPELVSLSLITCFILFMFAVSHFEHKRAESIAKKEMES